MPLPTNGPRADVDVAAAAVASACVVMSHLRRMRGLIYVPEVDPDRPHSPTDTKNCTGMVGWRSQHLKAISLGHHSGLHALHTRMSY